jgi:hypothetical protein
MAREHGIDASPGGNRLASFKQANEANFTEYPRFVMPINISEQRPHEERNTGRDAAAPS